MSYALGQYVYTNKGPTLVGEDTRFMIPITNGKVNLKPVPDSKFNNPCVTVNKNFEKGTNYFFHGKVKSLTSAQTFYIKLVKFSENSDTTQFIKKVVVPGKALSADDWYDVSFNFNPIVSSFDTIVFELVRIDEDYISTRVPIIVYEELDSLVNSNILLNEDMAFTKIGIQSEPGSMFIINGELIRIGNSGLFDFSNEDIPIYFFSAIAEAAEEISYPDTSVCLFGNISTKKREIKTFILDYVYEN